MLLLSQPTEEAGKKGPEAESKQATASITKATPGTVLGPKVVENNIQQGIQRLPLSLKSACVIPEKLPPFSEPVSSAVKWGCSFLSIPKGHCEDEVMGIKVPYFLCRVLPMVFLKYVENVFFHVRLKNVKRKYFQIKGGRERRCQNIRKKGYLPFIMKHRGIVQKKKKYAIF